MSEIKGLKSGQSVTRIEARAEANRLSPVYLYFICTSTRRFKGRPEKTVKYHNKY